MGRRKDERARTRGPYQHRDGWRVETIDPQADRGEGRISSDYFGTEEEARSFKKVTDRKLQRLYGVSFDEALTQYETWMVAFKGNSPDSAAETCRRLRLFFESVLQQRLARVDDERAGELYLEFTKRTYVVGPKKKPRHKPYSVAHHRHTLAQAKTFMQWCIKPQGWITTNPLDDVDGIGTGSVGKEQLTGDEAIVFYQFCADRAQDGDEAALGLVMLLLMALRQGDVSRRVVRDVDLDGTVLRIGVGSSKKSKTKKGDVPREIPAVLQPIVKKLTADRSPLEPLFVAKDGGFHGKSWLRSAARRFCAKAGVPYVCPHGLKGTAGTLAATKAGALANQIAEYLSHTSAATGRHYIADGATTNAQAKTAMHVIVGGKN